MKMYKKNYIKLYMLYFIIGFLLVCLIINIIFIHIYLYVLDEIIPLGTLNLSQEIISNSSNLIINENIVKEAKLSIFNPFIELFNQSNSKYSYFPSYFRNSSVKIPSYFPEKLPLEKYDIINNINIYQNYMFEYYNSNYISLLYDLHDIILEYIDLTRIVIQ